MIKLVVCDIDGTLVGPDEILYDKALVMVERLRGRGILFSLATGRADYLVTDYAGRLGLSIPYITGNGAAIVSGGKRLMEKLIPAAPLWGLIQLADRLGLSIVYSQGGKESVWRETPWILGVRKRHDRYYHVHRFSPGEWEREKLDKLLIWDDRQQGAINRIESCCRELSPQYTFTRYTDRSVEIVNGAASKAAGIIELVKILDISPEEVLAIGDHQNDIEMIAAAGKGAAVGNATAELKAAADYVCSAEMLEGVIEAVDYFCFSSKTA